jgi:NADH dehydrogenase FAD-containing subunit
MKTVILVGSGHAHLEVIKALTKKEFTEHRFLLISPFRETCYSGLIPRFIAGEVFSEQLTILSAEFAEKNGFTFIQDEVLSVDHERKILFLKSGESIKFDWLSLNVGGVAQKISSESPFQTIYLRPFDEFLPSWREAQRICSACVNPKFVVVGGGAAAVEVATALRIRLNKNQAPRSEVHLFTKGPRLCEGYSPEISKNIQLSLEKNRITVHFQEEVNQILYKKVLLKNGDSLDFDAIFIATPTTPSTIFPGKTDSYLSLAPDIFAVGDGTKMHDYPELPRSGVIAVHQGRHLAGILRSYLKGDKITKFKYKPRQLNILISGENSARLVWGNWSFDGWWCLKLKNWIDHKYMSSFKF